MATDWEEVKRLAADFQRAQLSTTVQRLSERNCIEIVNKLVENGVLEVLFTTDGKEYVTPQHLVKEIQDELFVQGGRIHLSDLAHILSLDYSHVESKASELVRSEKSIYLILGQLLHTTYVNQLFEEINEKLQEQGQMTIGELAKQYDLPPDFLQQMLRERLGTIIQGQTDPVDPQLVFTQAFIARHKARIKGALIAATKPTQLANVIHRYGLQERLFFKMFDELLTSGQIRGSLSGGRSEKTATYIPEIYAKAQNDWVDSFYKQNQYLEYDALSRLGLGDPRGFVRKRFKQEPLLFLETCVIGTIILDQVEVAMEEAVANGSWVDVATLCPSFFSEADVQQTLQAILQKNAQFADATILCDAILTSNQFIQRLAKSFDDMMVSRAEQIWQKGGSWIGEPSETKTAKGHVDAKKDRKDERRKKAAGGKSGGGTQGRETKTKSVKKKYAKGGRASDESDDEVPTKPKRSGHREFPFLTTKEIVEVLEKQPEMVEECPDEMTVELAKLLAGPLTSKFQEVANSVFITHSGSGSSLRKSHGDVQDKINGLVTNVHLFVKGIEEFAAEDAKQPLQKHLLKTVATDIVNLVFDYVSRDHLLSTEQDLSWTPEMRSKALGNLPENTRDVLERLNATLSGKSVDAFLDSLEVALGSGICDMTIRKMDKKKERQVVFSHRQALSQQLNQVSDPALVLHLASLILFQSCTHCMLHASGRFVPQILTFLDDHLSPEVRQILHTFQGLVIKKLTTAEDPEERAAIQTQLEQMVPSVKEVACTAKKGTSGPSSTTVQES